MNRPTLILAALAAAAASPVLAQISAAPAAAKPAAARAYTTTDTEISVILADPKARAIMAKHLPKLAADDRIEQAGSMTLAQLQPYAPDVTPEVLRAIDADFAMLAAGK